MLVESLWTLVQIVDVDYNFIDDVLDLDLEEFLQFAYSSEDPKLMTPANKLVGSLMAADDSASIKVI